MTEAFGYVVPLLIALTLLVSLIRRLPVFDLFAEGAAEGWETIVQILPNMVGMFMALSIWKASGLMEMLTGFFAPLLTLLGMPDALLPLALIKPLSGSGATAALSEVLGTFGPDSFEGFLASVAVGSSETLVYVLSVYAGAAKLKKTRYVIPCMLICWLVGLAASVWVCKLFF